MRNNEIAAIQLPQDSMCLCLGFIVAGCLSIAAAVQYKPANSLDDYMRIALRENPGIKAARSAVEAKKHNVRLALSIPDPKISGGYFISEIETRIGPQKAKIGASQMLPWPGKLAKKRKIARHELDAAQQRLKAMEAMVFAQVRSAYASLYAAGKEIEINKKNIALLKHAESVQLAKYAAAAARQASVLKIQVEIALVDDRLKSLDAKAQKVRAMLRALLDLNAAEEIPFPDTLPRLAVSQGTVDTETDFFKYNAAIQEAEANTRAAHAQVGLARQSFTPDFMVMTDYMFTAESESPMVSPDESGKDPWVIGASITIPLWAGSKAAKVRKARAMEEMKQSAEENAENTVSESSVRLFEDYADMQRKVKLYENTLIAKARQTLAFVEEEYANAQVSVLDFLDAQRVLLKLEIALENHKAQTEKIAGQIDLLLGGELTRNELAQQ